jgi:hypothetical protein
MICMTLIFVNAYFFIIFPKTYEADCLKVLNFILLSYFSLIKIKSICFIMCMHFNFYFIDFNQSIIYCILQKKMDKTLAKQYTVSRPCSGKLVTKQEIMTIQISDMQKNTSK